MSDGGLFMMITSWSIIIVLAGFCIQRLLSLKEKQAKHIKPMTDIDVP